MSRADLLRWKRVLHARTYGLEQTPSPGLEISWTRAGVSTRAKAALEGLASGTKYWFRVAAVGAAGQGAWSEVVEKVVG